jgi:hypothetical protein
MVTSLPHAVRGVVGGDFSDPTNERIIYLSAAGLAIVGVCLLVGTILWWRRGRQEHPALAPLEVMGTRPWEKAPEGDRRRRLDHVRPVGAGAAEVELARAAPVDLQALVRSVPQAFDDLREPGAVADGEAVSEAAVESGDVAVVEGEMAADASDPVGLAEVVAPVDVDATSIEIERPIPPVEVLAPKPAEPIA